LRTSKGGWKWGKWRENLNGNHGEMNFHFQC
jgi:hypothetical protein